MKRLFVIAFIVLFAIMLVILNFNKETKEFSIFEIENSFATKLESLIRVDGSFIYEYNIEFKNQIDDYNILRSCLATYSLIRHYEEKNLLDVKKDKVELMLSYIKDQLVEDDKGNMFIVESIDDEIKLGACALGLIDFCEYERLYNDDAFHDICVKLANGILSMQRLDGRFSHVLNASTFKLKEKDRIIYYEGESCLSLCKAYETTNDERYIEAVKKALNYYIESEYARYNDHWQEYAAYEITKFVDDKKYYNYGVKNILSNYDMFHKKIQFTNTDLELFNIGSKIANIVEKNDENTLNVERIIKEYQIRTNNLVDDFNSLKIGSNDVVEAFFLKNGQSHIRIDNLAHYILALL